MSISDNNKRIAKNTMMLYIRMLVSLLISVYTSRVIFNTLGVDNFGILNVAGGIIGFFTFINASMSLATQRFITYEIGLGDKGNVNHVFNTCMLCHLAIGGVILLISETVGLWFVNTQLNIPADKMVAANWIYQFSILSTILGVTQVPYGSSIVAVEKMGIYAYMSILDIVMKLLIVLSLTYITGDKLIIYGALLLGVSLVNLYINNLYCRKMIPFCRLKLEWDKKLFKEMISFSGWTLGGQMMGVAVMQGRNVLINVFYSVKVNAAIGVANQLCSIINGFVANVQVAFNPQLTKSFAQKDLAYSRLLLFRASKFSYFLLLLLSVPVYVETGTILHIWLGNYPDYTVEFCRAILTLMLVGAISTPIVTIVLATGKIEKYQIGVVLLYCVNLICMFLLLYHHKSPVSIIWIHVLVDFILLFWRLYFAKKAILLSIKDYVLYVVLRAFAVTLASFVLVLLLLNYSRVEDPFVRLLWVSFIGVLITSSMIYFFGLNRSEQNFILKLIKKKIFKTKDINL